MLMMLVIVGMFMLVFRGLVGVPVPIMAVVYFLVFVLMYMLFLVRMFMGVVAFVVAVLVGVLRGLVGVLITRVAVGHFLVHMLMFMFVFILSRTSIIPPLSYLGAAGAGAGAGAAAAGIGADVDAGKSVNCTHITAPYSASTFLPSRTMAFFSTLMAEKPHQPALGTAKVKTPFLSVFTTWV